MKLIFASTILFVGLVAGHASIISPCPRYSSIGTDCPALPAGQSLDADMDTPISSVPFNFHQPLCKHTVPWPKPAATWKAGESVTIKFDPNSVIHDGGDMEFSISYDGGKTFAVIYQVLRHAFLKDIPAHYTNAPEILEYTFTLPKDLPNSDSAVFAWTWLPASADREFYMNCADVAITGSSSKSYTAKEVTIVNYPGYPTVYPLVNSTSDNYNTGIQYYTTDVKNVTVSPNGAANINKRLYGTIAPEFHHSSNSGSSGSSGNSDSGSQGHPLLAALIAAAANSVKNGHSGNSGSSGSSGSNGNSGSGFVDPAFVAGFVEGAVHSSNSKKCTSGALECSGTGFKMCSNSVWTAVLPCGPGTKCMGSGNNIYCG